MANTSLNMPTKKSVGRDSHAPTINDFNLQMRQQPWYQDWFHQQGLDPNNVHLSQGQRHGLQQLILQKGGVPADAFNDMKIDPAGNLNTEHGFASQPTWLKALEIGAPIAGAAALTGGGALAGLLPGGGGAPVLSSVAPLAHSPLLAAGFVPGAAATTAASTTAAVAPSLMSHIASHIPGVNSLLGAGGRMIAQAGQASAQNRGAQIEATLAHDQLNLAAERQKRDAETDAFRKSLYGQIASGYQPSQRPMGVPSQNPDGFITSQARDAGQNMTDTAMARMHSGDYGTGITPMSQLPTKPGLMERIANYAGPAMSLFDPRLYDKNGQPHA